MLTSDMEESLDEAGFRHAATSIGERLGAQRIGATLYEAVAERPIWPYHYHYSTEEWMYVIGGEPMLRDARGKRRLRPGDLVCFPVNHRGAHTVSGPGRFLIFSTNESPGPWVAVYPDSDKIGVSAGLHEPTALNSLRLPRAGAVDYWHGEGSAGSLPPPPVEREPSGVPSLPVINVVDLALSHPAADAPAGYRYRAATLGPELGAAGLGVTVVALDRGEGAGPYRYDYGREEWVLILAGTPTLRHPDGHAVLDTGDVVCFPEGPDGAHRLINHADDGVRAIVFSTQGVPANSYYPDSGLWALRNATGEAVVTLREG